MKTIFAVILFAGSIEFHVVTPASAAEPPVTHPAISQPTGRVEFRSWKQGEPPVKLIRKEEGYGALTGVTGNFQGAGEKVGVYVGDDGYWYLGGYSAQQDVGGDCVVVRYATPAPVQDEEEEVVPFNEVKVLAATYSFGSSYTDVTERIRSLVSTGGTFQANPWFLQTDPQPGWNKCLVVFCTVGEKNAVFSVGEGEDVSRELLLKNARIVVQKPEYVIVRGLGLKIPAVVEFKPGLTASAAISQTKVAADKWVSEHLERCYIWREGRKIAVILKGPQRSLDRDLPLKPDDVIVLPENTF